LIRIQGDHLAEIDKKLGKMQEHQDEQYLAILRLTIMSEEMSDRRAEIRQAGRQRRCKKVFAPAREAV